MKEKKTRAFEVKGTVQLGTKNQAFTKTVTAYNPNHANEKILSQFGSKNKANRRQIRISATTPAKEQEQ